MSDKPQKRNIDEFNIGSEWLLIGKKVFVIAKAESSVSLTGRYDAKHVTVVWWAGDQLQEKTLEEEQFDLLQPVPRKLLFHCEGKDYYQGDHIPDHVVKAYAERIRQMGHTFRFGKEPE